MIEFTNGTDYSKWVILIYTLMNLMPLELIFYAIKTRKKKKNYLSIFLSILLIELSVSLVGSVTEQVHLMNSGTFNAIIVAWQAILNALMIIIVHTCSVNKNKKKYYLFSIGLEIIGVIFANYISYYVAVISLTTNHVLIIQCLICAFAIVVMITAFLIFSTGQNTNIAKEIQL